MTAVPVGGLSHSSPEFTHVAIHRARPVTCPSWLGLLARAPTAQLAQIVAFTHISPGGWVLDIRSAQKNAWENKLEKGFNTTDVPLEFCLLVAEVGEAIDAWRRNRQAVADELADVAIFLFGLAEMTGTDLQDAVETKLAVNRERVYRQVGEGLHVQVGGDA
jgi:NTP pyrophosphatase (non-canonical NTP hydrolase)